MGHKLGGSGHQRGHRALASSEDGMSTPASGRSGEPQPARQDAEHAPISSGVKADPTPASGVVAEMRRLLEETICGNPFCPHRHCVEVREVLSFAPSRDTSVSDSQSTSERMI